MDTFIFPGEGEISSITITPIAGSNTFLIPHPLGAVITKAYSINTSTSVSPEKDVIVDFSGTGSVVTKENIKVYNLEDKNSNKSQLLDITNSNIVGYDNNTSSINNVLLHTSNTEVYGRVENEGSSFNTLTKQSSISIAGNITTQLVNSITEDYTNVSEKLEFKLKGNNTEVKINKFSGRTKEEA
jgi:hypothetical protein